MSRLQLTRPVVGRQVVIELPEDWENIDAVDITLTPHRDRSETTREPSALYQALEDVGFIGCIAANGQLSTSYKEEIDFSHKTGEQD